MKNNIEIRNVKESVSRLKKENLNFDEYLEQNLIGWILGDGGLRLPKNGANPYFTYCDSHEDHIIYIKSILEKYDIQTNIYQNKTTNCWQLKTEALPNFQKYYNMFYGYKGLNEKKSKKKNTS